VTAKEVLAVIRELEKDRRDGGPEFRLEPSVANRRLVTAGLLKFQHHQTVFRNALLQEAVLSTIPEAFKVSVHRAAFRFYAAASKLSAASDSVGASEEHLRARLALHAARAGFRPEALAAYSQLAETAQSRHAYLDAEQLYSLAMEQTENPTGDGQGARMRALQGRGLMRYRLGRYSDAIADFASARSLADALSDETSKAEILLDEATALDWMDEYRASSERVELAASANTQTPLLNARLLMGKGRTAFRFNRVSEAAELLGQAAQAAAGLGVLGYETLVISILLRGYILATLGRLEDSEQAFDQVIPLCRSHGDKLHWGAAVGNRVMLWTARNDRERLLADLKQLLDISRELGNARMEQQAHYYLGLYLMWLAEWDSAEEHAHHAVAIDERRLGEAMRAESLLLLARVLSLRGELSRSEAISGRIRQLQEAARGRGQPGLELLPSEEVQLAAIELAARAGGAEEWEVVRARAKEVLSGQELLELLELIGEAALRRHDQRSAVAVFAEASTLAGEIPNVMRFRLERRLNELRPD
jgi:tetratricopeptide (TPR) repeat protein